MDEKTVKTLTIVAAVIGSVIMVALVAITGFLIKRAVRKRVRRITNPMNV